MLAAAGYGLDGRRVAPQLARLFVSRVGADGAPAYDGATGAYAVRLFKNGQSEVVLVDDYLPLVRENRADADNAGAAGGHTRRLTGLWVPLLEKAYAKYYGGYAALSRGRVHHALATFTGCLAEEVFLARAGRGVGKKSLWQRMLQYHKNGYILGAMSVSASTAAKEIQDMGLVFDSPYTIYEVRYVDGLQLLKIRNPPGDHEEWKGDWSDLSSLWTRRTKYKLEWADEEDNTFWMSFDDFCNCFRSLYVCHNIDPNKWKSAEAHGRWDLGNAEEGRVDTAAGLPSRHNRSCKIEENPQYTLRVFRPSAVRLTLSQVEMTGLAAPEILPVTMYLLRQQQSTLKRITEITRDKIVADTGAAVRERELELYLNLQPGTYTILVATYIAGMEGPFRVKVLSNYQVALEQFYPAPDIEAKGLAGKLAKKLNEQADKAADKVNANLDKAQAKATAAGLGGDPDAVKDDGDPYAGVGNGYAGGIPDNDDMV